MPHRFMGTPIPETAVYRVTEITRAEYLEPGIYAIRRGAEWIQITLRQAVSVNELADIVERISAIQILRVA